MKDILLNVRDLVVHYETDAGVVEAVNNISFTLYRGETLGLVGETGAGKTTTALSILRLVACPPGHIIQGEIELDGKNLMALSKRQMCAVRGQKISMIFQDPMTSLNPVLTVGKQIEEVIKLHGKCSSAQAAERALQMLEMVGIPAERHNDYPHQFSGGMKQRVVIAIALACNPELLIADEPTTALDVTIQAQILDMIRELKKNFNTSMLLITHDLGVVAETCDRVAIMYAGEIVELGSLEDIFHSAMHPYTKGLFASIPSLTGNEERLHPIPGLMPDPTNLGPYCSFCSRCEKATERCSQEDPNLMEISEGHFVKCFLYENGGEVNT